MTREQIKKIVSHHLGVSDKSVVVDKKYTTVSCSMDVGYDQLLELSAAIGTTKIDFVYREGEPGYSTWTPGTNGSFELTIGIGFES